MLTLTRRAHTSTIPLECERLTPNHLASLTLAEIAALPLVHGNCREPLHEFFEVAGDPQDGTITFRGDLRLAKYLGAGMTTGSVIIEGDVGMHAGAQMTGGSLVIHGNAADWLGAEMTGGSIHVHGNTGGQVGAAYRGAIRGMNGGTILIDGSAGDEVGLLMRRGMIVIGGDCGEYAGASMIAGTIIVRGKAGRRCGAGMKRGTIVTWQTPELSPGFSPSCRYRPSYLGLLRGELHRLGVAVEPIGMVDCYRGDVVHQGTGELLVVTGP